MLKYTLDVFDVGVIQLDYRKQCSIMICVFARNDTCMCARGSGGLTTLVSLVSSSSSPLRAAFKEIHVDLFLFKDMKWS